MVKPVIDTQPRGIGRDVFGLRKPEAKVQQAPKKDFLRKSTENKNSLYGKRFEDKKHVGANRVWNKNRPLGAGGKMGNHKRGV
jgi:hypothetical protein